MTMFAFLPLLSPKRRRLIKPLCAAVIVSLTIMPVRNTQSQATVPDHKNQKLPVDHRVNDLVSRMTLQEKVAELTCLWQARPQVKPQTDFSTSRGEFSPEKAREVLKHGIGQIGRQRERLDPREGAIFANALQKWLIENTRLGIPAILHDEILHGHMAQGSTSFPQPLALASSWDPAFIARVFTVAALETRARGSIRCSAQISMSRASRVGAEPTRPMAKILTLYHAWP